jgi:thioredoxin
MKLPKNTGWYGLVLIIAIVIVAQFVKTNPTNASVTENDVKKIANEQEFKTILDSAGSKMVVVDLYADWCGPCRMIQPTLSKLAKKYQGKVEFYKVNIDENPQIAAALKTQVIPYIVFIKDNKVVTAFAGVSSSEKYEQIISACAESNEKCNKILESLCSN